MDTLIEVTLVEQDRKKAELYMDKTFREFERLEKIFTGYDTIGEIYKINNCSGKRIKVNTEISYLVNTALTFSEISEGAFDISIWPLIRLWGFGLKSQNVPKV
ncbi:FAD:protein FMN transferase, partial [Candidatus Desantisbacteria bacterium]|nr:FAD:protein FMN transferase [Candidatus Desantisbacteria bacterium]